MIDCKGKKCIVRADRAGVFFGEIVDLSPAYVEMKNVRRLWYWDGACSCSDLAMIGTVKPDNCKFTIPVESMVISGVIEIIPATRAAICSIEGVKAWTTKK